MFSVFVFCVFGFVFLVLHSALARQWLCFEVGAG